ELREECARVAGVDVEVLLEAIRFEPFPEVEGVLDECARRGIALAVVSNWDVSLHDVLEGLGWTGRFGAVVTSAELGVAKPDPRPFLVALEALGVEPADAVHVGDDADADVRGAAAAGVRGVLLNREGGGAVASLAELLD
ncbi:MAG TPA: HAD-IA family hydrolase, partial [Solirubrobacteraceae bacterium]